MAVNEALSALSTTPASNTPAGTDSIGTDLDDHLRDIKKNVRFASNHPVQAAKITAYTVVATDHNTLLQVNATASAVTVTLLAAATAGDGFKVGVKRLNTTNNVTVDGNSSETIDGSATSALTTINQIEWYVCDGSKWHIESNYDSGWADVSPTAPNFTTIELGHASDTTLAKEASGIIAVEGNTIASLDLKQIWTKAQAPSTFSATLASVSGVLDYDAFQNFIITLASGSNTLAAPTTEADCIGQTGVMIFIQPSSSSAGTLSLHADYETAASGGITLSTANNDYDIVPYVVKADNSILLGAPQLNFG